MLELKNLSFSVNDGNKTKQILKDINLVIDDKKFTVITGPNGGGKSMLVDIIIGRHPLLIKDPEYDFSPSTKELVSQNIKYNLVSRDRVFVRYDNQYK